MGSYEKKIWVSTIYGRPDGAYFPYTPEKIFGKNLILSSATINAISTATGALATLESSGAVLTATEPLARLLLRSEAIASSQIEGLSVNSKKLMEREALTELNVSQRIDSTEASVLANIHVMHESVSSVCAGDVITLEDLQEINRGVLAGTNMEREGGKVRMQQNWIGGSSCDPVGAAYVPPVPEKVPELLEDLFDFINDARVPVLARAALGHAQFESIHPFADGNGRTGRALMLMILRSGGVVSRTIPPISLSIASDKQRYLSILNAYRSEQPLEETGVMDELVAYFCQRCLDACGLATIFEKRMELLVEDWRVRAHVRANSAASELMRLLPGNPVVSIQSVARLTGRSREAARNAINSLVAVGILTQNARNKKSNLYTADEVLSEFTTLERAGATHGHDTAHGTPAKPVAQRAERPSVAGMPRYADVLD